MILESKPEVGSARYGNVLRNGLSFAGTLSPRSVGFGHFAGALQAVRAQHLRVGELARHDLDCDVDHVVGQPAAVRVTGEVARESPEGLRVGRRRDAEVELDRVDRLRVLALLVQTRKPLQHCLHDVETVGLGRADVEQQVQDPRELRLDHVLPVQLGVAVRRRAVEHVLLSDRDDDLVHERVPEAGDLHVVVAIVIVVRRQHRDALALGRGPHTDNCVAVLRGVHLVAVLGDLLLGHLQHDGVNAITGEVVDALVLGTASLEVDPVERHAEVDEERIVTLAGEHLAAAGEHP